MKNKQEPGLGHREKDVIFIFYRKRNEIVDLKMYVVEGK